MSDQKNHLLENSEDYPQWTVYTTSLLHQSDCADAIEPLARFTVRDAKEALLEDGFTARQLTDTTLVKIVQDRKDKDRVKLSKAAGIIVAAVAEKHRHVIVRKAPYEMWQILKERFQNVSSLSLTNALLQISKKKMSDFRNAKDYCSAYEKTLNEATRMLREDSQLDAKGIEVLVQGYMITNSGDIYAPLIAQLRRDWKNGTVNFTETAKAISNYVVSNEKSKALHIKQKPQRSSQTSTQIQTCTTPDCLARGRGFHTPEQCWVTHPELRPKFPLRNMKTRGTKQNTEVKPAGAVEEQVHIDS